MSQNTPNLGLPYPELTDTADVPRDIRALADKLDALLGGGGSGGGGSGSLPLQAAPVLDVGVAGQVRAGRQLSPADFTSLGLSTPTGLWNLSNLTNQGSDARPLVNLGGVGFGAGINGLASTAAVFSGSPAQALYIADAGASDPYRIRTGSWGCWFRTAKRATEQMLLTKHLNTGNQRSWYMEAASANTLTVVVSLDGVNGYGATGVSDVCDDRWHFGVVTFDGAALRLYVDAVLEATAAASGALFAAAAPLNIGAVSADAATPAGSSSYGRVDEAFVTADVLTAEQVRCLYAGGLVHALGAIPTSARLSVHRRRKGAPLAVADFATQPVRLHNFTAGALTDQGSGGQALSNNGSAIAVAGADGTPSNAYNFNGIQTLSATDTGLPGGLTSRSYGCWFKTTSVSPGAGIMGWGGAVNAADVKWQVQAATGILICASGSDQIACGFVADGAWHLAVAVEDNAAGDLVRRKAYLDGRLVGGSTVLNPVTLTGANRFRIGAFADGTAMFTGQVDGVFVCGYALAHGEILGLYAKGAQDLGASPNNAGDHVERMDAASVLFIGDTLESQYTVDLGVVA